LTGSGQLPVPSHVARPIASPPAQLVIRHSTSDPASAAHLSRVAPSQLARLHGFEDVPGSQDGRIPTGRPFTATHLPTLPSTLHASHCLSQRLSQQTLSTQWAESQSKSPEHVEPLLFAHWPFFVPAHVPPTPHDACTQHTPSVQNEPVGHVADVVHVAPMPARMLHLPAVVSQ